MDQSLGTPPDEYPYVIDDNTLTDITDLHWYLCSRAMSDSEHESGHREVTWDSLGCSFQVARAFGHSVRVSFREGPPSDTDEQGIRDTDSEDEQRRQSLYNYDPTHHLSSGELYSQIALRTDVEDPPCIRSPVLHIGDRDRCSVLCTGYGRIWG